MKALLGASALLAWAAVWAVSIAPEEPVIVILGGDTDGYLSPCGCTKPMSGGIRRRATAIRALAADKPNVILENGGLISGHGRQDHIKAETLAEALKAMNASAINLGYSEAKMGPGLILSLHQLSEERFITSALQPSETNEIPMFVARGPFLIGGTVAEPGPMAAALNEKELRHDRAIGQLIAEARAADLAPVLMLQGGRELAANLARSFPQLRLIHYRAEGAPPDGLEWIGETALASPGEKGRHVVRLEYAGERFGGYAAIRLDPELRDNPDVSRIYGRYLDRIAEEKLLEKMPRVPGPKFAGNKRCGDCHRAAMKAWKSSKHAVALKTLETVRHDRDPDCVGCHVVGLESQEGFRSKAQTPKLANVGCESCHGPGAAHSANPWRVKMGKAGEKSCAKCHVTDHSPGFDFPEFWKRVAHR